MAAEREPPPTGGEETAGLALAKGEGNPWDAIFEDGTGDEKEETLPEDPRLKRVNGGGANALELLDPEEVALVEKLFKMFRERTQVTIPRHMAIVREAIENLLESINPFFITLVAIPDGPSQKATRASITALIKNYIAIFWLQNAMALKIISLVRRHGGTVERVLIDKSIEKENLFRRPLAELVELRRTAVMDDRRNDKFIRELNDALVSAIAQELEKQLGVYVTSSPAVKGVHFNTMSKTGIDGRLLLCTDMVSRESVRHITSFVEQLPRIAQLSLNYEVVNVPVTRGEYAEWKRSRNEERMSRHRGDAFARQVADPHEDEVDETVMAYRIVIKNS